MLRAKFAYDVRHPCNPGIMHMLRAPAARNMDVTFRPLCRPWTTLLALDPSVGLGLRYKVGEGPFLGGFARVVWLY
jgi:hypothetical protein